MHPTYLPACPNKLKPKKMSFLFTPNNVFVYSFATGQVHHEGNTVVSLWYCTLSDEATYLFKNANNTLCEKSLRLFFCICFGVQFWKGKHTW